MSSLRALRFWLVAGLLLLLVLVGSLVALVLQLERRLAENPDEILTVSRDLVGLPLDADHVAVSRWPLGLVLQGIRIPDHSAYGPGTLVLAEEAHLYVDPFALLGGRVLVTEVGVVAPVVRVVRGVDGGWNLDPRRVESEEPLSEPSSGGGGETAVSFEIESVRVTNGRVSYRDLAILGVPELEITAADARLRREEKATVVTLEARTLGGGDRNLRGLLRVPHAEGEAHLELKAGDFAAERLPELISLIRGGIPFGVRFAGKAQAELEGRMPAAWPPGQAAIDVSLIGRDASLRAANGLVRKPEGMPLELDLSVVVQPDDLIVTRAALTSAGARIVAVATGEPKGTGQPPLRVASSGLDAALLAKWMPSLAPLEPRGEVTLQGTVGAAEGQSVAALRLAGTGLELKLGKEHARLGGAALDLDLQPHERLSAELALADFSSGDFRASKLTALLDGGLEPGLLLRVDASRGGRAGAELDRAALECWIGEDETEVRRLAVSGIGGSLDARGSIDHLPEASGSGFAIRIDPTWEGVDFDALLKLLGYDVAARGTLSGRAVLAARSVDDEPILDTLRGTFDVRLQDGSLPDLNLARSTLTRLERLPGLGKAIDRRVREEMPALLAPTSEMRELVVGGKVADREVEVSSLRLVSNDYSVDARGQIGLDGEFDLKGDLVLAPPASRSLVAASAVLAALAPPGDELRIPVSIDGRYPDVSSEPQSSFSAKGLPVPADLDRAGGAGELLRRFFGAGPSE